MHWLKTSLLLILASPVWAVEGYIIGAGAEADSADGLSGVIIGQVGFTEETWLSASFARNTVDLPRGLSLDTSLADISIDHWFKPVGVRVGVASWGDTDVLDSLDLRASLYWRGDKVSIAADYERRDFDFNIPPNDFLLSRTINFEATGIGLTTRFELSDRLSLSLSGINYDYNVNLRVADNRGILDLLSSSRLSIINSLIDYRAGFGLGLDIADRHWGLDYSQREGAVEGSVTRSTTLSFLTPIGKNHDIEFAIGVDASDTFDNVTFFSIFLYFYGGS